MAASSHDTTSCSGILVLLVFVLLSGSSAPATAFNITKILDQQPDFSVFNSYLTQTQLAAAINARQTITVLAVANGAVSSVSGMPADDIRKVLSVHVVLDYYDDEKLKNLNKKSTLLTTLFQSSGVADGQMGFLNVTKTPAGGVRLGSAVPGAGLTVDLVKPVAAQPYNVSVLQVSGVIVPPGIQNTNQTAANTTTAGVKAPAAKAPEAAPAPKKAAADAPSASSPAAAASSPEATPSPDASSPPAPSAPSEAPAADSPARSKHASAPAGDSPSDSPKSDAAAADAPAGEEGDAPGPSASSGTRAVALGAGVAAAILLAAAF